MCLILETKAARFKVSEKLIVINTEKTVIIISTKRWQREQINIEEFYLLAYNAMKTV
jgi:hypothetical protein